MVKGMKNDLLLWGTPIYLAYVFLVPILMALEPLTNLPDVYYYGLIMTLYLSLSGLVYILLMKKAPEILTWKWNKGFILLVFGLLFAQLIWSILMSAILPPTANGRLLQEHLSEASEFSYMMTVIHACLVAPLGEELLCRGLLMSALKKWRGFYLDVLLSTAIFSLSHCVLVGGVAWTDLVFYSGPGLFLAITMRRTGSLFYCILQHALWNSFVYFLISQIS